MAIPRVDSNFFHAHTHSQYSPLDGTAAVGLIVERAAKTLGHPALFMIDHGNMAAGVKTYLECKKHGIKPGIGFEGYLIDPHRQDWEDPETVEVWDVDPKTGKNVKKKKKNPPAKRYHFGMVAINEEGYKALVKFNSLAHTRPRFNRFPRHTLADLLTFGKEHGDNVVFMTGCYFGLVQQSIARGDGAFAMRFVETLSKVYPHLFVEVQHHNICHDDQEDDEELVGMDDGDIVEELMFLADQLDLPVIATQDSHYLLQKYKPVHSMMKTMVYSSAEDGFPGDSFHLATTDWIAEHYTQKQWNRIEDGFDELVGLLDLHIEPLDNYKPRVPTVSKTPNRDIARMVKKALIKYGKAKNPKYMRRIKTELSVIRELGMANYFVIVRDGVKQCQNQGIVVESRGSANGSLVCFLLGITQVDPLIWGGLFERFLSLDRTKPPDIDLDIEDEGRAWLLDYWLKKYGAVQIGTWSLMGTTVDKETGEEKGSLHQTWITSKRNECYAKAKLWADRQEAAGKKRPTQVDQKKYAMGIFNKTFAGIENLEDIRRYSKDDYRNLKQMADMNSIYRSYGVHAGGVLLSGDDILIEDYIPTMLVASSNTRVSQYSMDDVEAFGLLKMDVLGQSSLRVMRRCQEMIGQSDPTDFSWIQLDDPGACKLLRDGRTKTGIFHFEGYTKAKGGRELGVKSTEDAVMVQALYMPGAMDSGATRDYLQRRKHPSERKKIKYLSPEFKQALERTYGTVVFQEQIIEIMRNLDMDIATINLFFKVVKDSGRGAVERNRARMESVRGEFDAACKKRGIPADEAWEFLAGFASYGFNRAHASGYGIRSYRTAYLKNYYPGQYMAALLEVWAGRDKERDYIREARRINLRLLPPDVNISGHTWTLDPQNDEVIRRGLVSISGVGFKAAEAIAEAAPFKSFEDMVARVPPRALTGGKRFLEDGTLTGIMQKLHEADALESLYEEEESE